MKKKLSTWHVVPAQEVKIASELLAKLILNTTKYYTDSALKGLNRYLENGGT